MKNGDFKAELEALPEGSMLVRLSGERDCSRNPFVLGINLGG